MSLIKQLKDDLNSAVKAGESLKIETLRGILADVHNAEIEKRTKGKDEELTDDEILSVLTKEAKKRKEASEVYKGADRKDLQDKEDKELTVIELYLPPQLETPEIEAMVEKIIKEVGGDNFGKVMQGVMQEIGGRAEAKVVSEIVKAKLG